MAAAETGSISNAAKRNHLAVAAASRRIAEFEQRIGVKLFTREPRGVRLTNSGHATLSAVRALLADANGLARAVEGARLGVTEHLRLLATNAAIASVLPAPLASFSDAHPTVRVELEESATPDTVRAIVERRASIGAVWSALDARGLENVPLGTDALVLIVPRRHPLAGRRQIAFAEALAHDFVLFETLSPIYQLLSVEAGRTNEVLKGRVCVRGFYAMSRIVEAGLGMGVVPHRLATQLARAMKLDIVRLRDSWARMEFSLVFRRLDELAPVERAFVDAAIVARADASPSTASTQRRASPVAGNRPASSRQRRGRGGPHER
ncbi:MAG: LysR family transcriptional regulator [Lautropia sp.]